MKCNRNERIHITTINNKKNNGYWLKQENQRAFLDRVYHKLQLNSPGEWGNVKRRDIVAEPGGNSFLSVYNGNFQAALQGTYPELDSMLLDVKRRKRAGYWKCKEHQRLKLEQLFHELGLKELGDWKMVTLETLYNLRAGVRGVIAQNGGNFKRTLMNIYPNYAWNFQKLENKPRTQKREKKKQRGHWGDIENQRSYFEELFMKLQLTNLEDWEKIKIVEFRQQSGCVLPRYRGNFRLAISKVYPNFPWSFTIKRNKRRGYWYELENQKTWMEKKAVEMKFESLEEWVTISKERFMEMGGYGILLAYRRNFFSLLYSIYPNFEWERIYNEYKQKKDEETSARNRIESEQNIRILQFFFGVKRPSDWYRISNALTFFALRRYRTEHSNTSSNNELGIDHEYQHFEDQQGASMFSVLHALKELYPTEKWSNEKWYFRTKKSVQWWVYRCVEQIFPCVNMLEDYHHPLLGSSGETSCLQLDIFLPSLNLALEYQGEQHFEDLPSGFASNETYRTRDENKLVLCAALNIHLMYVPYWWDKSLPSLATTVGRSSVFV